MKKEKYFTLISGAEVEAAAGKKVIPAHDFSNLLTSQELIEKIHQETAEYKEAVMKECETLKEEAIRQGFEEGYTQWSEQLSYLENEIAKVRGELIKLAMPIAMKAAKKIVAGELASSEEAIFNIVKATAKTVAQHKKIIIYVSKQDFQSLDKSKSKLKDIFEQLESLSLRERDDIEPGGCVIETESGIINAKIQDRWRTLEAAFDSLQSTLQKGSAA